MVRTLLLGITLIAFSSAAENDVIRRAEAEEVSVFMTQKSVDDLESRILLRATESVAQQSVNSIAAAVKSSIDTSFAFVEPLQKKTETLAATVASTANTVSNLKSDITSTLDTKVNSFKNEITKSLDDFKKSSDKTVLESLTQVNKSIDTVRKSVGRVRLDADKLTCDASQKGVLRMNTGKIEYCDGAAWKSVGSGSKTTYVNWGTNECKGKDKGITTLYSGYAWGGYHDHRGGADPVCLKSGGGNNGAGADGNDDMNLMYPLRTEGPGPQNGNAQPSRLIRCAFCKAEKHCYLEMGLSTCSSSAYEPMYSGSTYGGHHGHVSGNSRICLDRAGQYDNGNSFGAYLYPTKVRASFDGRNDNSFVHCHMCCEK